MGYVWTEGTILLHVKELPRLHVDCPACWLPLSGKVSILTYVHCMPKIFFLFFISSGKGGKKGTIKVRTLNVMWHETFVLPQETRPIWLCPSFHPYPMKWIIKRIFWAYNERMSEYLPFHLKVINKQYNRRATEEAPYRVKGWFLPSKRIQFRGSCNTFCCEVVAGLGYTWPLKASPIEKPDSRGEKKVCLEATGLLSD